MSLFFKIWYTFLLRFVLKMNGTWVLQDPPPPIHSPLHSPSYPLGIHGAHVRREAVHLGHGFDSSSPQLWLVSGGRTERRRGGKHAAALGYRGRGVVALRVEPTAEGDGRVCSRPTSLFLHVLDRRVERTTVFLSPSLWIKFYLAGVVSAT